MSKRSDLLTQLTSSLSGSNVTVSSELPWITGSEPLYVQNMKVLYLDEEQISQDILFTTLDSHEVVSNVSTINGYLQVDAKNQPGDIANVVSNVLSAKSVISGVVSKQSDYETEITSDKITYTFEYRFTDT
tara:strand:- start:216 stop:608 length:393 start_codon:yes stop_codon:yes gene_type:complete